MTTNPIALDLLKLAEHYLSALHGSVARHDQLGLNLSCGGCALRDEIRGVLPTLDAAVVAPPPATRADARDRIRRAICEAEGFAWDSDMLEPDEYGEAADAVLAVLPEPVDRAAVLREAIARVRRIPVQCTGLTGPVWFGQGWKDAISEFEEIAERMADEDERRMADEAQQQPDTGTPGCWCGHAEDRHWKDQSGRMTFPEGCHDCQGWNGAHGYAQELPWLPEGDEPAARARQDDPPVEPCPPGCVACATDESHDPAPAAGARQDGAQS